MNCVAVVRMTPSGRQVRRTPQEADSPHDAGASAGAPSPPCRWNSLKDFFIRTIFTSLCYRIKSNIIDSYS